MLEVDGCLVDSKDGQMEWNIPYVGKTSSKRRVSPANELKKCHVRLELKNMKKVKYATQLLSSCVADAVELGNKDLKHPRFERLTFCHFDTHKDFGQTF